MPRNKKRENTKKLYPAEIIKVVKYNAGLENKVNTKEGLSHRDSKDHGMARITQNNKDFDKSRVVEETS